MTSSDAALPYREAQPGPQHAALYASLVEDAFDFMVTIQANFTMGFASAGIEERLGRPREAYRGISVAEYLHPEDLERAMLHMAGWDHGMTPGGTTTFRLRHEDGAYWAFDVTASRVTDGVGEYLAVYCRPVDYQVAIEEVLTQLLAGGSRAAALRPVLDVFAWEVNDGQVSIAWFEPGVGHQFVSTGLPRELTGASDEPAAPWATARADQVAVLDVDRSLLDPHLAELAEGLHQGGYWIVPVPDAGSDVPALVTVWARSEMGRPDNHSYGMQMATSYIELILRWSDHARALQEAALQDPLTGLANRKALFDLLRSGTANGALLFCDLDHFKPVNDQHGHGAGDIVLCQIADRIRSAVRSGDLVARTGGDEFVVLAPGASLEQAAALAQRIRAAVAEPTELSTGPVTVGVTIGVAYAHEALTEATLRGADQALMLAKANARGTVRWAPGPVVDQAVPSGTGRGGSALRDQVPAPSSPRSSTE
jgi:diguanylate cyclase (GGDEF)-like protein/PAS domain S-box-containing protein